MAAESFDHIIARLFDRASAAASESDWRAAKQLCREILSIDQQHEAAEKLLSASIRAIASQNNEDADTSSLDQSVHVPEAHEEAPDDVPAATEDEPASDTPEASDFWTLRGRINRESYIGGVVSTAAIVAGLLWFSQTSTGIETFNGGLGGWILIAFVIGAAFWNYLSASVRRLHDMGCPEPYTLHI